MKRYVSVNGPISVLLVAALLTTLITGLAAHAQTAEQPRVAPVNSRAGRQLSETAIRDISGITGLEPGIIAGLNASLGDPRDLIHKAPIYKAISERLGALGGDKRYVLGAVERGADPVVILTALDYLQLRHMPISELDGIVARRESGDSWDIALEESRQKAGLNEPSPLTREEIREYMAKGVHPEDIVDAIGLQSVSAKDTRWILDEASKGRPLKEIEEEIDPAHKWRAEKEKSLGDEERRLMEKGCALTEIRCAQAYGKALGISAESLLADVSADRTLDQVAQSRSISDNALAKEYNTRKLSAMHSVPEATISFWQSRGLNPYEVDNVLRLAGVSGVEASTIVEERLSGLTWQEILNLRGTGGGKPQ